MRFPWRARPSGPARRLLQSAGVELKAVDDSSDLAVCRDVAYLMSQRDFGNGAAVLGAAEELLAEEENYEFVISFLEDLQNLLSHGLSMLCAPEDITTQLGQRCAVCWISLTRFWDLVAAWCSQIGVPLDPSGRLLSVQNENLRVLLWTANRTTLAGKKLGLAEAVRYEKAGGEPLPGYSHIAAVAKITGQD